MKNIDIPTLEADDIEVKIKQVTQKGAFALLYKTARTDMRYLDEAFGADNWQIDYQMVGDMLFCSISIWDDEKQQWIKKQSNGVESREDGEGNEVKGLASDCMKRAGFMVGIGRELYSSPRVFLNVATKQDGEFKGKPVFKLEDPWAKYIVTDIAYDNKRRISKLIIANEKTGDVVYRYGGTARQKNESKEDKPTPKTPPKSKTEQNAEPKQEAVNGQPKSDVSALEAKVNAVVETSATIPPKNEEAYKLVINKFNKDHNLNREKFVNLYNLAIKSNRIKPTKKLNELEPDEWISLIAQMQGLFEEGFFSEVA